MGVIYTVCFFKIIQIISLELHSYKSKMKGLYLFFVDNKGYCQLSKNLCKNTSLFLLVSVGDKLQNFLKKMKKEIDR